MVREQADQGLGVIGMRMSINKRRLHSLRAFAGTRHGVVSVVSMMFLILFGSLAAAMAMMSRGNITTAATHQHVIRAQGAAETGMAVAIERLVEASNRFVVSRSEIDSGFATWMWGSAEQGTNPSYGDVIIRPPVSYASTASNPRGIAGALVQMHAQDQNLVIQAATGSVDAPSVGAAPTGTDATVYALNNWVFTPAVALTAQPAPVAGRPARAVGTAYQVQYMPLANGTDIRVAVTGFDFDYSPGGEPIARRIVQDVRLAKEPPAAVVSPSKIMIGKNVLVEGDLGATFTSVSAAMGDPLVVRSDFAGLDTGLDAELTKLFTAIRTSDVDKDNRLRVTHPTEGAAIPDFSSLPGYAGWQAPAGSAYPSWYARAKNADATGDGYVDEFDVFVLYYDGRSGGTRDGKVALPTSLSANTPNASLTPEFVRSGQGVDDQLALLLDSANPDRNKNGQWAFLDNNANGRFDPGTDELLDQEVTDRDSLPTELQSYVYSNASGDDVLYRDMVLGFRDGVIDRRDQYAKVRGRLMFRVQSSAWNTAQPNYMDRIRGPIIPPVGQSPMQFSASTAQVPDLGPTAFAGSANSLQQIATGSFNAQVAQNLGISESQLATWTAANNPTGATAPKFSPLSPDANRDGLPDNWTTAYFEKMPFNGPQFSDWYYRPVYENMTFRNVQIPKGTNALFRNCTFIGVTWVRTNTTNTHPNWTNYGKLKLNSSGRPIMDPPRVQYTGTSFPTMLSSTDRPVWMATTPLDKADIPANEVSITQGYNLLPDPLIVDGRRVINTKDESNNIRFHDCLIVGSVTSDAPTVYTHARNKLQFTGKTKILPMHPTQPTNPSLNPTSEEMLQIRKSSLMVPQYSVDVGSFNSPTDQDVRLRGTIIAGVLDVRGNADLQGSLIMTFRPELGQAPLIDSRGQAVGNPANFNASIGYFGPSDGDEESLDPRSLPLVNGRPVVGWDADGDGLADYPPSGTAPAQAPSATPVYFNGYGRVTLRFDPTLPMPDGISLPLNMRPLRWSYEETRR